MVLGGSISAGGDTHLPKEESYFAQATVRPPLFLSPHNNIFNPQRLAYTSF